MSAAPFLHVHLAVQTPGQGWTMSSWFKNNKWGLQWEQPVMKFWQKS